MSNYSLSYIIRKNKMRKDGTCPIYARIEVEGDRVEFSTKRKVKPKDWVNKKQKTTGNTDYLEEVNNYLDVIKVKALKAYNQLLLQDELITAKEIRDIVTGKKIEVRKIIEEFEVHNRQVKKLVGTEYAEATYTKYERIKECLEDFIWQEKGQGDVPMREINLAFIQDLESYLKSEFDLSHNTALKYLDGIKKIVLKGFNNGWIDKNPFVNYKRREKKKIPTFLTDEELKAIQEVDLKGINRLQKVKDFFVFSCFTGLSYKDLNNLTYKNLREEDGEIWINTRRTKTKEPVRLILLPPAMKIYRKYEKQNPKYDDVVLPVTSNQNCNAYLKEIADLARIKKKLTFHVARHTFATTVTLNKGVPMEVVQILMGHSSRSSTEHYARINSENILNELKRLR
ncbi:site-specific integrase [Gracilimonas sp.]|uniref:site-specific integrase n=1 Tax=Gracilimonas sp. TaxID=1974203 RepID=UPI003BAC3944